MDTVVVMDPAEVDMMVEKDKAMAEDMDQVRKIYNFLK